MIQLRLVTNGLSLAAVRNDEAGYEPSSSSLLGFAVTRVKVGRPFVLIWGDRKTTLGS